MQKTTCYWLLMLLFFSACIAEPDIQVTKELKDYCPSCIDTLTWNSYGEWELYFSFSSVREEGRLEGTLPINLASTCGWNKRELSDGIIQTTYVFTSIDCGEGVRLEWKSGLSAFQLTQGWLGSTREGIQIGTDLTTFLTAYPSFEVNNLDTLLYDARIDNIDIIAVFDEQSKLEMLRMER